MVSKSETMARKPAILTMPSPAPRIVEIPAARPAPNPASALSPAHVEAYHGMGFVRIPGFFDVGRELAPVIDQITRAGQRICGRFDFDDASHVENLNPHQRGALYKLLRYLPSLMRVACGDKLIEASRALGLDMPMVLRSYNIRMDTPHRDEFLFHWHQDITYLLGSLNSVTYWIPLGTVNAGNGSVEVVPGSHRAGIAPFRFTSDKPLDAGTVLSPADIHLAEEPSEPGVMIEAEIGDLVLFSQFLLHRSTPNRSRLTRWTVQVRHADAFEPAFIDAGYPCGDATNIYHTDYLGKFKPA